MPHIHEKYDFVISLYIVHKDKVLLVNHPRYNMWIPPGGHVELDEDPEQTIYREAREETGLEIEILADKPDFAHNETQFIYAPRYMDVHDANAPHKHIALVYFARSKSGKYVLSAEHTDMQWLSLKDLDKPEFNLAMSVKFYCQQAVKAAKAAEL